VKSNFFRRTSRLDKRAPFIDKEEEKRHRRESDEVGELARLESNKE